MLVCAAAQCKGGGAEPLGSHTVPRWRDEGAAVEPRVVAGARGEICIYGGACEENDACLNGLLLGRGLDHGEAKGRMARHTAARRRRRS